MGKHSFNRESHALKTAPVIITSGDLATQPKPGSRRALREAQRAAQKQKALYLQAEATDSASLPAHSTSPAPQVFPAELAPHTQSVVNAAHTQLAENAVPAVSTAANAAPAATAPAAPANAAPIFAEQMNEQLVISKVRPRETTIRTGLFSNARAAVVALVATTSIFSVAAGINSMNPNNASAYASQANLQTENARQVNTSAIEKINYRVKVDGKTLELAALSSATVAQALENAGIVLGAADEISVQLNAKMREGMQITIARIKHETHTEEFIDKFQNIDEEDPKLPKGETKIATAGVDGRGTRTYTVKYRDGQEIGREVIAEALTQARVDQVTKVGTAQAAETESGVPVPPAGPAPSPGSARAIAQEQVAGYGWGAEQFACLDALWQRESGWNAHAMNRSSGAYGIPQSLPGSKMASAGADWQTNPATQIRWGLGYISGRYGTPCGAWGHSQARGWY